MDDSRDIQQLIIQIEREIHDLKTSAKVSPVVKTFWASIEPQSQAPITITYASGEQPIITQAYCMGDGILGPVSGNQQKLFYSGYASVQVTIVSTRPILSVSQ